MRMCCVLLLLLLLLLLFFCPEVLHSPRDSDIAVDVSLMSGWSGLVVCGGKGAFKCDKIEALDGN